MRRLCQVVSLGSALLLAACSGDDEAAPAPTAPAASTPPAAPAPPEPTKEEPAPLPPPLCVEDALLESIAQIEGAENVSEVSCGQYVDKPARCFALTFRQALEHGAGADGATFEQRVQLIHRGCDAPTTIMDNGYGLPKVYYEMEPSILFGSNTIAVEHRFQGRSLPPSKDRRWSSLSIENGAGDVHNVIAAFKKLYTNRWVSTGASKGGITAVYHRYLHPSDVDGTIAYVAPASRAREDARYQAHLGAGVLPAACASAVRAFQVGALSERRPAFTALLQDAYSMTPEDANYALESVVSYFDWSFWQTGGDCAQVPSSSASEAAHLAYFESLLTNGAAPPHLTPGPGASDLSSAALAYEWGWEQGFAEQVGDHVKARLLTTAVADARLDASWASVVPDVTLPGYDGRLTNKVRDWVRTSAERVVLIYGEFDPWTGGALDAPSHPSSGRFIAPGADHGANIGGLSKSHADRALAAAAVMYGRPTKSTKTAVAPLVQQSQRALLRHELAALRRVSVSRPRAFE